MNKILIAGGTGFVGRELIKALSKQGYKVNILSRKEVEDNSAVDYFLWDIEKGFIDEAAFEGVTTIINLTGTNIGEARWTARRKVDILESRTRSIGLLLKYVRELRTPVHTFISSSGVNYYGSVTTNAIFSETSESGDDFLAEVCKQWEESARQFETIGARVIILRKGVVLGIGGGMYQKLMPMARLGINTALGNGRQYLPWIDIHDLVAIYEFILKDKAMNGVFNAVASQHITMNEFSATLLNSLGKSSILPNAPAFILKSMYGEMSVMLLNGSRVSNEKLKHRGFEFKFDSIDDSLKNLQITEAAKSAS